MNMEMILEAIQFVGYIIMGGLALYFKYSEIAQKKAKEVQEVIAQITARAVIYIKEAEEAYQDTTNMGGVKFNEVVTRLYELVPEALRGIITKDMIANIVQDTFDQIEAYVALQINEAIEKAEMH